MSVINYLRVSLLSVLDPEEKVNEGLLYTTIP